MFIRINRDFVPIRVVLRVCTASAALFFLLLCDGTADAASRSPAATVSQESVFAYTDESGITHLSNVPSDSNTRTSYRLYVEGSDKAGGSNASGTSALLIMQRSEALRGWVAQAARDYRLEAALLYAVMDVESGFNPRAVSPKGARGIMQLMPAAAGHYGVTDPFDAEASVFAGARLLRDLLDRFDGDLRLTLAAYNAGSAAVDRYHHSVPPYSETQAYVPRVLTMYRRLGGARLPGLP